MDAIVDRNGRGRRAHSPSEIPGAGWKDVLISVYRGVGEDRVTSISGGVVFFALLAIFPGIAALIALYGLIADPATAEQHVGMLSGIVPTAGLDILREELKRLTSQPVQRLGWASAFGLAISLWSANGGVKAIFDALNVVFHENEKRGFFRLNIASLVFTILAIVFSLLAVVVIAILPSFVALITSSGTSEFLFKIGRWPILLVAVSFAIALLYRFGPSRNQPKWKWISPGSAFASLVWIILSIGFSWYAENFANYDKTYGSLGAVIAFMVWMWLSTIVILIGAKLNAELEHQTHVIRPKVSANPWEGDVQ
jgi:membrane protein